MIDKKDIIELDDNKNYIVISKVKYNAEYYFYLLQVEDQESVIFGYMQNDEFVEVTDQSLIRKLIPLFANENKEILESINNQ